MEVVIMHTLQGAAKPTPIKNTLRSSPAVFEWYENRVEEGLAKLYHVDVSQRQKIVGVIREMDDSTLFSKLRSHYTDAQEAATDDETREDALMALLARIYIAGTLRGCKAVDL
jgi:hypothetical protein